MTEHRPVTPDVTGHEHWFTSIPTRLGPYGPQGVHYHPCIGDDAAECHDMIAGAGRDCGGRGSAHERMTLTEDGPQPPEALERLRAAVAVSAPRGEADLADDPSRAAPAILEPSRERVGAVPVLPLGAGSGRDEEAGWRFRARVAEAKLATINAHCRGHLKLPGSCCPHLAEEILAITGTGPEDRSDEGEPRDG